MKFADSPIRYKVCRRPPRRGAWIEIEEIADLCCGDTVAPRAGGRGLKWIKLRRIEDLDRSPPAQGGVD